MERPNEDFYEKIVHWKNIRSITKLYLKQKVAKKNESVTSLLELGTEIRQDCCLSSTVVNLCIDNMLSDKRRVCIGE